MKTFFASHTTVLGFATVLAAATGVRQAFTAEDPIIRNSFIETTVSDQGGGVFKYEYRVVNDSPAPQSVGEMEVWPSIVGYEIPLDHPSVVWGLSSPETWNYRFLSASEYQLEYGTPNPFNSAYVLQWYDEQFFGQPSMRMIVPEGYNDRFEASEYEPFADGFSFLSNLSPVDGPYANLWVDMFRNIGDPPLPGGGIAGGGLPYQIIPEVPAQGLMALACLGVGIWLKARSRRS